MDQRTFQQAVRSTLGERGFHLVHESAAVMLLASPEFPDVIVRVGVTRVVAERCHQERYRESLRDFDLDAMLSRVSD